MTRKRNDRLGTRGHQTVNAATIIAESDALSREDPRVKIPNGESRTPPALGSRNEGVTAEELAAASGRRRHTVRAAPTRPRRAYHIVKEGMAS